MIFRPLVPALLLLFLFLVGALLILLIWMRATRRSLPDLVRRGLIVVLVTFMAAGPSIPSEEREVVSSVETYFVIDRTGSMGAEDWDGNNPRIEGVRSDIANLIESMAGSRFSIISWDSSVHTDMPLTTDTTAITSYMNTFSREMSDTSQGSSPDRPASALADVLEKSRERHPNNVRAVFIFSDGESSNHDHWTSRQTGNESDWDRVKDLADGGLVIGYGTEEGGPMKVQRLGEAQSGGDDYIRDLSQAGNPIAISRIDEAKLRSIANRIGVDYMHSPDNSALQSHARSLMDGASTLAETRNMIFTYRYMIWPFAVMLSALLAWEGYSLAKRAQQLRNSHAI